MHATIEPLQFTSFHCDSFVKQQLGPVHQSQYTTRQCVQGEVPQGSALAGV